MCYYSFNSNKRHCAHTCFVSVAEVTRMGLVEAVALPLLVKEVVLLY